MITAAIITLLSAITYKSTSNRLIRSIFLILYAIIFFVNSLSFPPFVMGSMMTSSLYGIIFIKMVHTFLSDDSELSIKMYLWSFFYLLLPLQFVPESEQKKGFLGRLGRSVVYVCVGFFNLVVLHFTFDYMKLCLEEPEIMKAVRSDYLLNMKYSVVILLNIVSVSFFDFLNAVLWIVTLGKIEVLDFNRLPILSTSFKEMWGRRYNRLVSELLKETVFLPSIKAYGSPALSGMLSFVVSGLLHTYVSIIMFQEGLITSFFFFIVNGFYCLVETFAEKQLGYRKVPGVIRWAITMSLLILSSPLYLGLFVQNFGKMTKGPSPLDGYIQPNPFNFQCMQ
eukprot:TRINITY_DN1376_c0_g1_i8.p1 TRINITY_DN1376_c0_g1~~TRINITY_DN1376_c0_g1_i8.p1  ORF type:complete len:338 (+),score=48.37 TRINITY_DN1376_c0_g1_i8:114-1127(+)